MARTPTISGKIGAKPFVNKNSSNSEAFPWVSLVKSYTIPIQVLEFIYYLCTVS